MSIYKLAERKEDWHVLATGEWWRGVQGMLSCRGCERVRLELFPRPIDIELRYIGSRRSVAFVSHVTIGVIHRRLLDRLGEHLTGFALGDVYDQEGAKMDNFRTFYSGHSIIVRGSADAEVKQCQTCGEIFYPRKGEPYILRHQLGPQHVYYESGDLCVDEWLASRIDWSKFRDIELVPYPVRDLPEDGLRLPGDPDWSAYGLPCREPVLTIYRSPEPNVDPEDVPMDAGRLGTGDGERVQPAALPPPLPQEQPMEFRYFAGPLTDMAGLTEEGQSCSLCGRQGPCFALEEAICPQLPEGTREDKIGCYSCLREGRLEFRHGTEKGMLGEDGLTNGRTRKPYLPKGFSKESLVELRRTPQIVVNQEERWLTHCNDFMAYQGVWSPPDFYEHAPDGDGRALFMEMTDPDDQDLWDNSWSDKSQPLGYWYGTYYVFKCLHCGKLRGNWDVD